MQKVFLIVLLAVVALTSATYVQPHYEPQDIYNKPNCAVVSDHSRKFRDISDPTHYWICPEGAEQAEDVRCQLNEAFLETEQQCVNWQNWKWIEPYTK